MVQHSGPDPAGPDPTAGAAYRAAGVDITAGNRLVDALRPLAKATARPGAAAALGGFAAVFDPRAAGFHDPLLLAATDGVGTKLRVAHSAGRHDSIGVDLVAMCVNDVLVHGGEPLFFLDYFATGKLDGAIAAAVVAGIADGCRAAGCALIGGETAEMPGFYAPGDYDLAGFAVGAVERDRLLTGASIQAGDAVLGLASSGLHANGFSLVRKLIADQGLDYGAPAPFDPSRSLAEALLAPTRIYVQSLLPAIAAGRVAGLTHITGGGLVENIPRCLPDGLAVTLDTMAWPLPPVFRWLAETVPLPLSELAVTFNCGIGMVAMCTPDQADSLAAELHGHGETVQRIGTVVDAVPEAPRVRLHPGGIGWPA